VKARDAFVLGGFAAAAPCLGRVPDLVMLDMTDPAPPRALLAGRRAGQDRGVRAR